MADAASLLTIATRAPAALPVVQHMTPRLLHMATGMIVYAGTRPYTRHAVDEAVTGSNGLECALCLVTCSDGDLRGHNLSLQRIIHLLLTY